MSIIMKVKEGENNCAIKQHFLSNSLPMDAQFGFRQDPCFPDDIIVLVQTWSKELNSRGVVRSEVGMFAHDYTMFSTIQVLKQSIFKDLDNIQVWADKWH
eukprot:g41508.t1